MDKVLFSHKSNKWNTPDIIYNYFMSRGYVDPFPRNWNGLDYKDYIINLNHESDGLISLFINPPFELLSEVVDFVCNNSLWFDRIAILMPVRTDTRYFERLVDMGFSFYFIKGRLHFNDSKNAAPFPTMLCFFNHCDYNLNRFHYIRNIESFFKG